MEYGPAPEAVTRVRMKRVFGGSLQVNPIETVEGLTRWEYTLYAASGRQILCEDDLTTQGIGWRKAAALVASMLLADLDSPEETWARQIRSDLVEMRADLERWARLDDEGDGE